ncbi:MAG: Clp protease ClpP [Lachnospiraceae bacterium]|nr:Clp protease ClpP [Lachnospiraceae bacterium]
MPNIEVKGTIVSNDDAWIYDWCDIENTCPKKVKDALEKANGEPVTIEINSGGGDVFAGNEIYYAIQAYRGQKTIDITGLAASAATIVSCAGDTVRAVPGMEYMIHNVSTGAYGDYNEMNKTSEVLQNANKAISNIYKLKTGMSHEKLLKLMNEETWMDAEKAKEYGFIDEIIGDNGSDKDKPFTIYNAAANVLSDSVKEKIRNAVKNPNGQKNTDSDFLMKQEQIKLLRMRGEIKHV